MTAATHTSRPDRSRRRAVGRQSLRAVLLVVVFALVGTGLARADAEPNNFLYQAEGPVTAAAYSGTIQTANDEDWYLVYVASQTQLDITFTTPPANSCSGIHLHMMDTDGSELQSATTSTGVAQHIRYTTPAGTSRYFFNLHGSSCVGKAYGFSVSPAAAVLQGPAMPIGQPTGEPNDVPEQAIGPLQGEVSYRSVQETSNDEDWYYFYANGNSGFDISQTGVTDCGAHIHLFEDDASNEIASGGASVNRIDHLTATPAGFHKYLLQVHTPGCVGASNDLRITPASALSLSPPAPAAPPATSAPAPATSAAPVVSSRACRLAVSKRVVAKAKWRSTKSKLARSVKAKKRHTLRKKLRVRKANLRYARYQVRVNC